MFDKTQKCEHCGSTWHDSEGGCGCGGEIIICSQCGENICREGDAELETRNGENLCVDCAAKHDHTCATCGEVCGEDLVNDGESVDGEPWMVCRSCKESLSMGAKIKLSFSPVDTEFFKLSDGAFTFNRSRAQRLALSRRNKKSIELQKKGELYT